MARFMNIVIALTLFLGVGLFTWQHSMNNFTPSRANRCAMTYFQADMTGLDYGHSFYEITKFNIGSPILPSAHELFTHNDATLQLANKASFSTPPSHPEDELQHLLFFFPGNAGNRWQGRSLGTKINKYIRQISGQLDSYSYTGLDRKNTPLNPALTALPAKLSYLLGEALTSTTAFHSSKAFRPKYYQAESMSSPDSVADEDNAEWFNSGNDVIYRIDSLVDELLKVNPEIETSDSIATILQSNYINNHIYTFSFNEQSSAFSGLSLQAQEEYAVASIVRLVEKVRQEFSGKVRISLVGHSMGGAVAMATVGQLNAAIVHKKDQFRDTAVATVVTIGTPVVPLYIADYTHLGFFEQVNKFAHAHERCNLPTSDPARTTDPLICNISVLHIDGGQGDELIPSSFSAVAQYRHFKHPKLISATDLSVLRSTSDHDCLAYCAQVMESIAQFVLRRIVIDSLAVGKVNFKQTVPDERIAVGFTRPKIDYLAIPPLLQSGIMSTSSLSSSSSSSDGVYVSNNRFEFKTLLTKTLPVAQVSTAPLASQSSLLNFVNTVMIGADKIPHTVAANQYQEPKLATPIESFSITFKDIAALTQQYTTDELLTEQLPALTKSIPLSALFASSSPQTVITASQTPVSLYLCPDQLGQSMPLHACVDITSQISSPIPTPELLFSIFRQPHTHRPEPDNHVHYLSRTGKQNHNADRLPGDDGYLTPRDLTAVQHGLAMNFDLERLYQIAKSFSRPENVINAARGKEQRQKWANLLKNFNTFKSSFALKAIVSPPVLEGLLTIQDTTALDLDWAQNNRIPLFWTAVLPSGPKNTPEPVVDRFQLILADPTTPSRPIHPNCYECEILSASLLNSIAFPIISLEVTTHTTPHKDEVVFISQTHQLEEKSPYTACLLPPTQRAIQGTPANAYVDLVTGHVYPRPRDQPKLTYDETPTPALSIHNTVYGLLPAPSHLTSSIEDAVLIDKPPLKRPVGALPDKSPILDSTVVIPVLLPQAFDVPTFGASFKRIVTALLTLLIPMLSLSLHFVLISVLRNLRGDNRQVRWLSSLMDQLDSKSVKEATTTKHKPSVASRIVFCGLKYIMAVAVALAITIGITLPFILRSDERLQQILPAALRGYLSPLLQAHSLLDPVIAQLKVQFNLILTLAQQNISAHVPMGLFTKVDQGLAQACEYIYGSWMMKLLVPFFYFFSHAAAPVSHALNAPLSDAILTTQVNLSPFWVSVEHVLTAGLYYTLAYLVSQLILGALCLVTGIISIPHRLFNFVTLTLLMLPFPRSWGNFITAFWTQFVFPLWLSIVYILPVTGLFVYSAIATLAIAVQDNTGIGFYFVQLLKSTLGQNISTTIADGITTTFSSTHCYLKHGIYWLIHVASKSIAANLNVASKEPTQIASFLQTFDKTHVLQKVALYLHRLATDFQLYTSTALSPNFKCFIHPKDYQLLPIPVTTASILFVTLIWTLLFVIAVRYMTTYQFATIDEFTSNFYNTKESKQRLDDYKAKVAAKQQGNDDGLIQEETHYLNRLIQRDVKASRRTVSKAFYALIVATLFVVFLILPSTNVISDVSALSLKNVQYRELYLGLQGANPIPGSYIANPLLTAEQFHLKLKRESIEIDQFYLHGQDTASFSLFYTLFNIHPHSALTPSQIHNIFAKVMLTAQWYQQRGAWMPTVPVDMFTAANISTSLAFTALLLIQLLTALTYFTQVNNAKLRILDITRAMVSSIDDVNSKEQRTLRQRSIHLDPPMIIIPTTLVAWTASILTIVLSLLVFAPYLLPLFTSASELLADKASAFLPSLEAVQTPFHQSKIPITMMVFAILWTVQSGLVYKLVIPNEVNRPYKEDRVA